MADGPGSERDDAAVLGFVERFSARLADSGWPRMPARVFVALLATDSGRLTAAELAGLLRISPAAVSGAVRYLTMVNMAGRERDPGSRRDVYRVRDDVWQDVIASRDRLLGQWREGLREGIAALGRDTPAGERVAESADFFEFMRKELASMVDRWREHRDELRASRPV